MKTEIKIYILLIALLVFLPLFTFVVLPVKANSPATPTSTDTPTPTPDYPTLQQKLTVCHATGDGTNPYVHEVFGGHDAADNYYSGIVGGSYTPNDIIPPNGSFNQNWWGQNISFSNGAQNWTPQGQAIWNNACVIPLSPSPTLTSTPTSIPTVTPSPTLNLTPTPTPTSTPTPSPTLTLTPTQTPVPSITPTPTRKPRKPKHTPVCRWRSEAIHILWLKITIPAHHCTPGVDRK